MDYRLTNSGTTWTLTDPDDTVETYSQSGTEATLQSIKLRNGYTQTMHYTSSKLSSVTDTYGRHLGISYSSIGLLTGLTTPDSLSLTYGYVSYSSGHLLSTVTYNTSPATHQTYSYSNTSFPTALTGITDENGHSYASWTYDSSGRGATSQFAGGVNFTSVSYFDSDGHRNVKGPLGIQETYKFTTLQGAPKISEIDRAANGTVAAATEKFAYDSNGYTQSVIDWNGNQTYYTNNSHGLPTQIVYASGSAVSHTTNITYDTTWARLAHIIATPGLTTTLNYDSSGNVLTRVDTDTTTTSTPYSTNGQTRTWTMTYTSSGQLTSRRLPRTDVYAKTAYSYTGGALTFTSDALGHTITVNTFKPGGLPLTMHDANNVLTTRAYSPRLWLTSSVMTTSAGNLTTSLRYDSVGELTRATLPDGSYLNYAYNNAHQPITILNRINETENLTYNSAGNLTQTLWKTSGGTTTRQHTATFDALGRMLTDVGGVSQTTTFGYDSNGNVISTTDPLGHISYRSFDALNRMTKFKDAATDLTTLTYDAHNRPLTITDPKNNATSYVYDGWGDLIQQTSSDSGTTVFWYDKDSNVTTKKDAAIQYTSATYDALDRPLTRTYPADSTLNVAFTYDQTGTHGKGIGHLTSQTDQAGSLSLSWEERGLVTGNARTIGATTYTTGYTYESAGRLASITYPTAGWVVKYTRDSAGQITTMTDTQPSHSPVNLVTSATHEPFGPLTGFFYGNGVHDTRTYDLDYRMTSVKDASTGNIQYLSSGYDADNNVHTITDNVTSGNSQTLTYDVLDRLKTVSGAFTVGSITYDSNSNRLAYNGTNNTVPSTSNKMSAVGASSMTYSSTGNLASLGASTSMAYSKANQLGTITISGTATNYTYGADGYRLTAKTGTNAQVQYAYGPGGELLAEDRTTTSETDYAWLDGNPVAIIQPLAAAISAIHADRLGTPQKATDATKTLDWALLMNPNGAGTPSPATVPINLRWPGQHVDSTGYFDNGFRTYIPITVGMRYMEVDPLGLAGSLIGSGGGTNVYPYGGNNAFKNIDPWGLDDVLGQFFQALLPVTTAPFSVSPIGGSSQSQIAYGNQVNAFRSFEGNMASIATAFGAPVGGIEGQITSGAVCRASVSPEARVIAEAGSILSDPAFSVLRAGYEAGRPLSVRIGGRVIQYEPDLPGSGLSLFGENGFLLGPEAFASESETQKTLLHELYRLTFSQSANGVSGELAAQETMDAATFAAQNAGQLQ